MRSLLNLRHPLDGTRSICWLTLFVVFVIAQAKLVDAQESPQLDADRIFESGRIINVEIEIEDENWEALSNQTRDFLAALSGSANQKVFTYFPAKVTIDGVKIENVGVRKKGFLGSLDKERPSLKIKFSEYEDKSVSKGFDRLTLNNNKQDPSRLCQVLSYELFNESGSTAPRCNFARVTVNGKHLGIYSNVESIKEPFLKARFGDGTGALYEGTTTDLLPGFARRLEAKNKAAKHEAVLALAKLLEDQKLPLEEIKSRLDVESFLRFWATESLIGFWDGYSQNQNNYFVYRVPETGKFQFIPWGLDSAFTQDSPLPQLRSKTKSVYVQGALANHFYRDPDLRKQYEQAMRELLENHWDEEALLAKVDRLAETIRDEIVPENRRGFEARIREIKKFITDRRDQVTQEMESGKVVVEHGPRRPIGIEQVGTAKGTFKTQWYDKSTSPAGRAR